jgi:hypothetical protein
VVVWASGFCSRCGFGRRSPHLTSNNRRVFHRWAEPPQNTACVGRRLACFPLECICWPTYSGPKVNSDCCLCVRPSVGLSGWGSPGRLRNHHAEVLRGSRPACPFRTSSVPTLQRALYKFRLLLSHTECYPVVSICRHPTTCVGTGILQSRLQAGSIKTRSRLCPPAGNQYLIRGHGRNFSPPIKKDRD